MSNLKKLERQEKISTVSQLTLFLSEHHDDVLRISAKIQRSLKDSNTLLRFRVEDEWKDGDLSRL